MWMQHGISAALLPSTACHGLHVVGLHQNRISGSHVWEEEEGSGHLERSVSGRADRGRHPLSPPFTTSLPRLMLSWQKCISHLLGWKFDFIIVAVHQPYGTVWVNGLIFYLAIPLSALLPCVCHHNITQGDDVGVNTVNHVFGEGGCGRWRAEKCDVASRGCRRVGFFRLSHATSHLASLIQMWPPPPAHNLQPYMMDTSCWV